MASISAQNVTPAHNLSKSSRLEEAGHTADVTQSSTYIPRGDTTVPLNYFSPPKDGTVPFNYVETPPEGTPTRNFTDFDINVDIHDIRGQESKYTLDKDAFAAISDLPESAEKDFTDDESIKRNYYPELEQLLLKEVPGATRVVFFDHTIRRSVPNAPRGPVSRVHIDQTAASARQRVIQHTGEDAEELLKGRYRIINVWRPLNGPVQSFPLAVASSESVQDEDLIPIRHIYPDREGQTAGVRYNSGQKWNYWSGMTNNERLLLECFDSEALKPDTKVQGGRVPHTAFTDARTPAGAVGRESIEVRTLVFGA